MSRSTPCLCCKFPERVCSESCPAAPFFPETKPQTFEKVNRLYGASNILRMLGEVPKADIKEMFDSFNFEAGVRDAQPITGCAGMIIYFQCRAGQAERELKAIKEGLQFLAGEGHGSPPSETATGPSGTVFGPSFEAAISHFSKTALEPFESAPEPFGTALGLSRTASGPFETPVQQNERLHHKRPIDDPATDHNLGKKLKHIVERVLTRVVPVMQYTLEAEMNKQFTPTHPHGKVLLLDNGPSVEALELEYISYLTFQLQPQDGQEDQDEN